MLFARMVFLFAPPYFCAKRLAMIKFEKIPPPHILREFVRGYWLMESQTAQVLDLIPDGYPEIFFVLGTKITAKNAGRTTAFTIPGSGGIGQLDGIFSMYVHPGARILSVKIYPWAYSILFDSPAHLWLNQVVSFEEISNFREFRRLAERVGSAENIPLALCLLNEFLIKKIRYSENRNPFLQFAVRQIFESRGTVSIERLTANIHASRRYVEKLFKMQLGMSPKKFSRQIRIKKASMYLQDRGFSGSLKNIMNDLNYYDQSHFLKDFKSVVGLTPSHYLALQQEFPLAQIEDYLGQWDYS